MPIQVLPGSEPENPPIPTWYKDLDEVANEKALLDRVDISYSQASPIWQGFWNEANMDMRTVVGDQSVWSSYGTDFPTTGKRQLHFNIVNKCIEMVCGRQRQQRKTTIVTPQQTGYSQQQMADDLSNCIQWAYAKSGAYEHFSDAFASAQKVGLSFIESWLDRREDLVNGDIKHRVLEYSSIFCDPFWRNPNLSDCSYIWVRRYMDRKALVALMPKMAEEIMSISTADLRDAKFYFMPENNQYSVRGMIPVDEYWYADVREVRALVNMKTGEMKELKEGTKVDPQLFVEMEDIKEIKYMKPTVRLGIIANRKVLYHGPNPLKIDRYPFTPILSYFEPAFNDWPFKFQGITRRLRDPQYIFNRMIVLGLDGMESQVNAGELVEEDFYLTPEDAQKTGNGTVRFFKRGKDPALSRIREQPAQLNQGMVEMSQMMKEAVMEISGISEALLGLDTNDTQSGVLNMLRQSAGIVTLETIFNRFDNSQAMIGDIDIEIMQKNWNKWKFARILGRMPSEDILSPYIEKYDISIEDGMNTSTQRQMQAAQLYDIYKMGIQTPEIVQEIMKTMNLQNKNDLVNATQAAMQQQQQQLAHQQQIEMQNMQIENEVLIAKSQSDKALAAERMSKMQVEKMESLERMEKAHAEDTQAMLNLVKALKELKGLDLEHLKTQIETLKHLSELSMQDKEKETAVKS
jgi:hypothetical protein